MTRKMNPVGRHFELAEVIGFLERDEMDPEVAFTRLRRREDAAHLRAYPESRERVAAEGRVT